MKNKKPTRFFLADNLSRDHRATVYVIRDTSHTKAPANVAYVHTDTVQQARVAATRVTPTRNKNVNHETRRGVYVYIYIYINCTAVRIRDE